MNECCETIGDPRSFIWKLISEFISKDDLHSPNAPKKASEGMIGAHPVALLQSDPINVTELCGWESVIVPKWISSTPSYGIRHMVGVNIWGRDDYTVSQVSTGLLAFLHCKTCDGISVNFTGPRTSRDGFIVAMFTLSWSE